MNIFDILLWPLRWLLELGLVGFHGLFTLLGFNPDAGVTWVLAIGLLLVVVRLIVLPSMIKSVKSARALAVIMPDLEKIRKRYEGQNDPAAKAALSTEVFALYRENNTSPFGAFIPVIIQLPLFFALYSVLRNAQVDHAGVGALTQQLAHSFAFAHLLGAPLRAGILGAFGSTLSVGIALLVITALTQFATQFITYRYNRPLNLPNNTAAKTQRFLLIFVPVVFVVTSLAIPLGLLFYLTFSSVWSLVQQAFIIRFLPMPGSRAAQRQGNTDA